MNKNSRFTHLAFLILIMGLVVAFIPTSAQDSLNQAVNFNDVTLGEINLSRILSKYTFSGDAGETVYLRTQSLTQDFVLEYNLTDANGAVVAKGTNVNGQPGSLSIIELPSTGDFTIQIQSGNGMAGQYAMTIETAPDSEMPVLPMGELVFADAPSGTSHDYSLNTMPEGSTFLMFESLMDENALGLTLRDPETDEIIAMFRPDVSGVCMRIAPNVNQRLTVASSDASAEQDYQIMLWHSDESNLACPSNIFDAQPNQTTADNTYDQSASLSVTPLGTKPVNLRAEPSTQSSVVNVLNPGNDVEVIGTTPNGYWLMVDAGGTIGWVYVGVVTGVNGNITDLPVISVTGAMQDYALADVNVNGDSNSTAFIDIDANDSDLTNPTGNVAVAGNDLVNVDVNNSNNNNAFIQVDANTSNPNGTVSIAGNEVINTSNDIPVNVNENTVNDTVNQVNNVVDNTVNETNNVVNNTANDANATVNNTVNQVSNTVGGLLGN